MGCLCDKHQGSDLDRNQVKERAGVSDDDKSKRPQAYCVPFGKTIYLPNPEHEGLVDFNAELVLKKAGSEEKHDEYVLEGVEEGGLAYNAGFRNGDVLIEINGENIEDSGIEHVLELLRNYKSPEIFLGVRRNDPALKYIWVIFKIVEQDGVPTVRVQVTLQNDEYVLPQIPSDQQYFQFDRESTTRYDIFIESDRQFYLSVDDEPLFNPSYNVEKSSFYKYYYKGNQHPEKGEVVVYSLQDAGGDHYDPDVKSTIAGDADNKVNALGMPKCMVGEDLIPSTDPRFWYEKKSEYGGQFAFVSLESVNAPQYTFLNMSDDVLPLDRRPAVLSETPPVNLTVASSDNDAEREQKH